MHKLERILSFFSCFCNFTNFTETFTTAENKVFPKSPTRKLKKNMTTDIFGTWYFFKIINLDKLIRIKVVH